MNCITNLFEHQNKAVEKLSRIKVGALYMEQGTGKTRTALELIKLRLNAKKVNKILWLCPCSVKQNLMRDIIKHTGDEQNGVISIVGIETLSSSIKTNLELMDLVKKNNIYLIVDESNLVKNPQAKRTQNIIRLAEKCKYKLILNGTPVSRNEADLYSQWYILDWRILGYKSFWSFAANHLEYDEMGRIVKALNVNYLTKKIAPYTYQIKKSECLDLPDKTYEICYYNLTQEQKDHYFSVADVLLFQVNEFQPETIYRLFSGLQNVISGYRVKGATTSHLEREPFFNSVRDNPRIDCLLNEIAKTGEEKIIIFAKYADEINDIVKILKEDYGKNSTVAFYGEIKQKQRQKNIEEFSDKARFFVANKVCAGYGLNLQFCSYIIYYSNDWDYATRSQSEDRVHRIGQDKNVHIIDICAENTLDKKILKCLWKKEDLVDRFKEEIEKQKDLKSWLLGAERKSKNEKVSK
jgi:SNF2 family DNA or RNA helicase